MGMRSSLHDVRDSIRGKISIEADLSSHDLVVKIVWRKLYDEVTLRAKVNVYVFTDDLWIT